MWSDRYDQPPGLGYFQPQDDGALLSLLMLSTPGHPVRERQSEQALAEQRFLAVDMLERGDLDRGHATASQVVQKAVAGGAPFGLYLRNFGLIGVSEWGAVNEWGEPQVLTVASTADARLQQLVTEHAAQRLPFVAIESREVDGGPFPRFIFADEDWEEGADTLIRHAAAVVMLYGGLTPGVTRELDLLRQAGAQSRTLLVVGGEVPTDSWYAKLARGLGGLPIDSPRPAPEGPPPEDFPNVLVLPGGEETSGPARHAIQSLITSALAQRPAEPGDAVHLPPPLQPGQEALDAAQAIALEEFDRAVAHVDAGELEDAEDALMRSIAFSHWARDPAGRLVAYLQLGGVERRLGFPNTAINVSFLALYLTEVLAPTSELAAEVRMPLADGIAAELEGRGDAAGAAAVRERAATWVAPEA